MPTVPQYQRQSQIQAAPVMTSNLRIPENPLVQGILQAADMSINMMADAKRKADLANTQNGLLQVSQFNDDQINNPRTGLITKQGKDALGQSDLVISNATQKVQDIASTLPEGEVRDNFMRQAQVQLLSLKSQATRYEVGQHRQYEAGQQDGYLRLQQQQALNPQEFNQSAMNAYHSIIAYGQAHGQSSEEIEANWAQWREQAANRASEAWYTPMYQQLLGPNGKVEVTDTPSESQLFSAMLWQESGGNQYGKDGAPLVSPKGAVGVAQVMEDTGPEAARLAGVAWDRDKWLNDPRYNAKLGQAYFGAQMTKYGNNPVLAVAAYNAGPGAVDGWIKKIGDPRTGAVSNEQFAAAIPYEETRNYVANVTGSAGAIPGNATMESLINQPFWNAMSPQNKSAMMSKMAGMYDMQAAAGRVSLQSRMQDDLTALEAGKPVNPISAHEWAAVMPLQASPAERIQLEKTYQQYQQTMQLQPVYQTIVNGTAQQGIAAVQSMAPQEGDPDFKFKQALYATAQAKLNAVQTAREKDPGTWLQLNSPVAKNAFEQYQNNQASGEYLVSRIQSEKDRLGINSKKILPESMVDNLLRQIDNSKETSVVAIQQVAQSFGKYSDQVMQQVQKSAYPALQVVMATNNPRAANALWQNRALNTSDLRGSLPKTDADSADSNWNDKAKDFAGTMVVQPGGAVVWNNFNEQGKRLTYTYMQRGMSPSDAAKQAYQDVLGEQYQTNGTWRMPVTAGQDIRDVNDGASEYLKNLKADQVMPLIGDPRLPESVNREQTVSRLKDNAQWVTNSDETGLTLMMNGLLVNDANGRPITMSYGDLAKLGAGNRSTWNSITKFAQTPVTYTPGQSKNYSMESQRDNIINTLNNGQQTGR
ncbi:transglycosylase SLT domain-containing protein [Klebsiella variicola]